MRANVRWLLLMAYLLVSAVAGKAWAAEIAISQYAVAPGSFPWAIAQAKGYYKEFGVDITGIQSAPGSAPAMRMLTGGNLPFAEAGITGVIAAIKAGADLKVISGSTNTFAEVIWATMPNSSVKSINDLKGRKIGFTTPKSSTNMMAVLLLKKIGLKQDEAQLIAAGGFAQLVTALEAGGVDVAPMVEPAFSLTGGKYRVLAKGAEVFPAMSNVLGITTAKAAKEQPEFLRGIILARRKAVVFMLANTKESAQILAPIYKIDAAVIEKVIIDIRDNGSVGGIPFWGPGDINVATIETTLEGARTTGEITEAFDVRTIIDESFLPADLKSKK